jgi:hypothetical protein
MIAVIICFVIVAFAVIAYCGHCDIAERETEEQEAFERRRAERQAVFDRHAQEVARACLMETCENIYLGRCGHE